MHRVRRVSLLYWGMGIGLTVAPLCWSFELLSFQHAKEGAYGVLLLFLAVAAPSRHRLGLGLAFFAPLWLLLLSMATVALLLWPVPGFMPAPSHGVEAALRMALLLFVATWLYPLYRFEVFRRQAARALILSGVLVSLLALGQFLGVLGHFFPEFPHYDQQIYSVFGNQDDLGGYLAIMTVFVATAWLQQRMGASWALPLMALMAVVLLLSGARSAWLAAAIGSIVAVLIARPPLRRLALAGGAGVLAVAVGVALHGPYLLARLGRSFSEGDIGWQARRWMWEASWAMVREQGGWLGVGLGQYPSWSNLYGGKVVAHRLAEGPYYNELLIEHAHSEYLEWIAEGGLLALVFGGLMFLRVLRHCGPAWPALATLFVFGAFNSPFHSAPHAVAGLVLMGMAARGRKVAWPRWPRPWLLGYRGLAVLVVAGVWGAIVVPSYLVRQAEAQHLGGENPLAAYERAEAWGWPHGEGRYSHGVALMERGAFGEAIAQLEGAGGMVETGRRYALLGALYSALGQEEAAQSAYRECMRRWPWWQGGTVPPAFIPPERDL